MEHIDCCFFTTYVIWYKNIQADVDSYFDHFGISTARPHPKCEPAMLLQYRLTANRHNKGRNNWQSCSNIYVAFLQGSTAATNMNEHSSRSHAIFSITVERCEILDDGKQLLRQGKLHLVDLAVSFRYYSVLSGFWFSYS